MKCFLLSSRSWIGSIVLGSALAFTPFTSSFALSSSGCCSDHGGVIGCDASTNHIRCKDGSTSPTCLCEKSKSKKAKQKVETKKTAKKSVVAPAVISKEATKGCCSNHGGVDRCDKRTGFQVCKDGSHSSTCKC